MRFVLAEFVSLLFRVTDFIQIEILITQASFLGKLNPEQGMCAGDQPGSGFR
jgi:hypothetical protein